MNKRTWAPVLTLFCLEYHYDKRLGSGQLYTSNNKYLSKKKSIFTYLKGVPCLISDSVRKLAVIFGSGSTRYASARSVVTVCISKRTPTLDRVIKLLSPVFFLSLRHNNRSISSRKCILRKLLGSYFSVFDIESYNHTLPLGLRWLHL